MLLIPHSTNVTGAQALALLESLIPTLGLDPAQEIGMRNAIEELHDLASGGGLDAQLEAAREAERAECEDEHANTIKALERQHADALDAAREESRETGYALGVTDAESVIERLLTLRGFTEGIVELLEDDDDFATVVEDEREAREHREAVAERERLERAEQAERDRLAAIRKRGAPRKPRVKKAGSK
jgi:hypothetical protein